MNRTLASARSRAQERAEPTDGAADVEARLTQALEDSGRLRTLSHRASLAAFWAVAETDRGVHRDRLEMLRGALERFSQAADSIRLLADETVIDLDEATLGLINRFIADGHFLATTLTPPAKPETAEIVRFAAFVSIDLMKALDGVAKRISEALTARAATRSAASEDAARVTADAVENLQELSMTIQLISLNASVEAARAGQAGRGFGVIAMEMKSLGERSQKAVGEINRSLSQT